MRRTTGPRATLGLRDRADRPTDTEPAVERLEALAYRALGGGLHARVERRVELEPALEQLAIAVALGRDLAHVLDEERRREVIEIALIDECDRLGERGLVLRLGQVVLDLHELEHAQLFLAGER